MRGERGISPIIATVLLILLVAVIGSIIFLWARGFVKEDGTKFGQNIRLVCKDIKFEASYLDGQLTVHNTGDVPIFRVNVKMYTSGGYQAKDINVLSSEWPAVGVKQGEIFSGSIGDITGVTKIVVIPILVGSSGKGEKVFTCEEQYYEVPI